MGRECLGHGLAILGVGARHGHEKPHRDMRRDIAAADFFLYGVGQEFDQRQAARNPADAPVEPAGQFLEAEAEPVFQFRNQPALLQCSVAVAGSQRLAEQQRLGFIHLPDRGPDRILAQLPQRGDPLVPVDHQVLSALITNSYDHDRDLLARSSKRCQQLAFAVGAAHTQVRETEVELVKLKIHRGTLSACREHSPGLFPSRCRSVTACPRFSGLTEFRQTVAGASRRVTDTPGGHGLSTVYGIIRNRGSKLTDQGGA
jgi:hypothetical protein